MKSHDSKRTFAVIFSLVLLFHLVMIKIHFFDLEEKRSVKSAFIHNVYLKHYGLSKKGEGSGSNPKEEAEVKQKKISKKSVPPVPLPTRRKEMDEPPERNDDYELTKSFTKEISEYSDVDETANLYEGVRGINGGDEEGSGTDGISLEHIKNAYLQSLKIEIEKHKKYPYRARLYGQTGTVGVCIVILEDGSIADVRIVRSSGYPTLNDAALRLLKKIKKFQPIPVELGLKRWEIIINIEYFLSLN